MVILNFLLRAGRATLTVLEVLLWLTLAAGVILYCLGYDLSLQGFLPHLTPDIAGE